MLWFLSCLVITSHSFQHKGCYILLQATLCISGPFVSPMPNGLLGAQEIRMDSLNNKTPRSSVVSLQTIVAICQNPTEDKAALPDLDVCGSHIQVYGPASWGWEYFGVVCHSLSHCLQIRSYLQVSEYLVFFSFLTLSLISFLPWPLEKRGWFNIKHLLNWTRKR